MSMNNVWFEIRWYFKYNWPLYLAALAILGLGALTWHAVGRDVASRVSQPAVITTVAAGTIVSIRATGSFDAWCRIELKFDDGTILLTSYGFINTYKVKQGRRYIIKDHSRRGRIAIPQP